jgi:protein-tyrosine phosphatase
MEKRRILFVCLGNICRSPLGEGILRQLVVEAGLSSKIETDSAGTGGWHEGEPPDVRSIAVGRKHGIDISAQRARKLRPGDFGAFDLILAMDRSNLKDILNLAPPERRAGIHLFMEYAGGGTRDVPDPYYGDARDFQQVYEMLRDGCERLIPQLVA